MEKFTVHTGTGAPLRRSNVDTDQIIPAVYLKRVTRDGFRKEFRWTPGAAWSDAGVAWRDADTLAIEFNLDPAGAPATITRKLTDPTWTRIAP